MESEVDDPKAQNNIVDLNDSQEEEENVELHMPRHMKKALSRLSSAFPFNTKHKIAKVLQTYCDANPNEITVINIVEACSTILNNGDHDPSAENETQEQDEVQLIEAVQKQISPLEEVLRVLPNAKTAYVESLLAKFNNQPNEVLQDMLEKGYEKAEVQKPVVELDFTSTSWVTTPLYRQNALIELGNNFPYLKVAGFPKLFETHKFHYYATYKAIYEVTGNAARYSPSSNTLTTHYSPAMLLELRAKCGANPVLQCKTVPKKCIQTPILNLDPVFVRELQWFSRKQSTDMEQADKKLAEELNEQIAGEDGCLIECGCCCSEYAFESCVQCSEGHLFCKACLAHYVEQTVFGDGRSVLKCMSTMETCDGIFSDEMIRLSLPEKVFAKFSEAQSRDALKAANIDNLLSCYNCSFQVEMTDEAGNVLNCPSCFKSTCKLCKEESHVPLKCSEVEKKGQTSKRLSVEEAMTEARIRECPKCKTRFFKIEGCNKMTCTCNTLICYICRADVTKVGYAHFCQAAHCDHKTCGKCKLYTNSVEVGPLTGFIFDMTSLDGNNIMHAFTFYHIAGRPKSHARCWAQDPAGGNGRGRSQLIVRRGCRRRHGEKPAH